MSRQTWFITGASSGLGAATAKAALRARPPRGRHRKETAHVSQVWPRPEASGYSPSPWI